MSFSLVLAVIAWSWIHSATGFLIPVPFIVLLPIIFAVIVLVILVSSFLSEKKLH